MIEIEVQKAIQGDCIWIRCIGERNINIVIDAGPATFAAGFKKLVEKISDNKEKIDLLVFTHIDDDHIRGCTKYFNSNGEKIIDKVWLNGEGISVYLNMQEHSVKNVRSLVDLLKKENIPIEQPIMEGSEYVFTGGKVKVIGPTESEIMAVANRIETAEKIQEHSSHCYVGNIDDAVDVYERDTSITNRASLILVIEFDEKKLLFLGDSTSENVLDAINKYCKNDQFEIVKLPHHGSHRNISRKLIRELNTERYIISTNKRIDKVVFQRFMQERENKKSEILCNYDWWSNGYFTDEDTKKYIKTDKLIIKNIGEEKVII